MDLIDLYPLRSSQFHQFGSWYYFVFRNQAYSIKDLEKKIHMDAKIQNMAKVLHISFFLGMQNRRCCHGLNLRINHHHLSVRKIFGGADREEEWIELVASITTAIQNAATLPVVAEVGEIANSNGEALGAGQWRQVPCALHQGVECDEGCELCLAFPQPCVLGFNSLRSDLLHQLA